jgi:hypothetical protein
MHPCIPLQELKRHISSARLMELKRHISSGTEEAYLFS